MTSPTDSLHASLRVIAGHGIWLRDAAWTERWFHSFLSPLYAEGLFLPPLFAYDLCSAAAPGERRYGKFAVKRDDFPTLLTMLVGIGGEAEPGSSTPR